MINELHARFHFLLPPFILCIVICGAGMFVMAVPLGDPRRDHENVQL